MKVKYSLQILHTNRVIQSKNINMTTKSAHVIHVPIFLRHVVPDGKGEKWKTQTRSMLWLLLDTCKWSLIRATEVDNY